MGNRRKYPAGVNGGTNRNMAMWGNTLMTPAPTTASTRSSQERCAGVGNTRCSRRRSRQRELRSDHRQRKIITGRQCQPDATNDFLIVTAHDAQTGKEVWRNCMIPRPGEPGVDTWGGVPSSSAGTSARGWCKRRQTNMIFVGSR